MKKHIPNLLTICNLLCGCVAAHYAFLASIACSPAPYYKSALIFVLMAAVFDFLDGFAARLLKAYSPLGKQLDSLADLISFGLTPAIIAISLIWRSVRILEVYESNLLWQIVIYSGFIIAAFSALRLAKFNIDDRQTSSFIGLAVPANAIFWVGLGNSYYQQLINFPIVIGLLIAISCFLLVCKLPMFSLKFKHFGWKGNEFPFILIICSAILLIFLRLDAFAWIIVLYILLSLIKTIFTKKTQLV